ncbi:hypothetical protein DM01DRAFT_321329, partial [Hesseltinella vesiculosa]
TSAAPTTGFGGGFGATATSTAPTTGLFGAAAQPTKSFGGFGAAPIPSTATNTGGIGSFGQAKPLFGQPAPGAFGQPLQPSMFGAQPQQPQKPQQPTNTWQQLACLRAGWDPSSKLCNFNHFFYNSVSPNQVHLYMKPADVPDEAWVEAQRLNPDPTCMVPVRAVGFQDLLKRINNQDEQSNMHKAKTEELKQRYERVQHEFELKTVSRVEEYRRRHIYQTQRLIQFLRLVQMLRYKGADLTSEEEQLKNSLEKLASEQLNRSPDSLETKIGKLWMSLNQIKQQESQDNGLHDQYKWQLSDETSRARVAEALSDEQTAINHVVNLLHKDMNDLTSLEAKLKLNSNKS